MNRDRTIVGLLAALVALAAFTSGTLLTTAPASAGPSAGLYEPVTPFRAIDTRDSGGTRAGQTITVSTDAPAGAVAVAVNVTMAGNAGPNFFTAWSGVGTRPGTSLVNSVSPGNAIANFAIVPLGPGGTIAVWTLSDAGIIVDVMGYVLSDSTPALDGRITATVTGYDGQSGQFAFTKVLGTVTNGTAEDLTLRMEVPCGNGLTATDLVFIDAGATLGWSVVCDDVFFTSGATVQVVRL